MGFDEPIPGTLDTNPCLDPPWRLTGVEAADNLDRMVEGLTEVAKLHHLPSARRTQGRVIRYFHPRWLADVEVSAKSAF
jgi:hypothetical protein